MSAVEHHRIEQSPVKDSGRSTESFSGHDRMALYEQHAKTVGSQRGGRAGGDSALPSELTFNHDIYGSASKGAAEGKIQLASLKDNIAPDAPRSTPLDRARKETVNDATKFAFGESNGVVENKQGKEALNQLVQSAYQHGGQEGLQKLADGLNDAAIDKYGKHAFDHSAKEFDESLAVFNTSKNKDGSTHVQFDFAKPYSKESNSAGFDIPKPGPAHPHPHPITGNYQI